MSKTEKLIGELQEHCQANNVQLVLIAVEKDEENEKNDRTYKTGVGKLPYLLGLLEVMKLTIIERLNKQNKEL